ncbi:tautomerase family protein [Streptomyces netropsis]|uniref:Enamine deaminase RidA (YjgF/YER057c/UK114 family) n=1 Tax=Streptomyces netropsis TaxID=55404 RepID=A0A7W7LD08_STRNE|nr:tautomerase family protein [Streptomyces netropsis]MBB4887967.1 enamine deaminase RidA (YjgF/YER057c/UK114 family) [Streptomyces netropsis]GGR33029.1 hypothetical protein GCM10010219_42400 [Streptomyces netropsis]
MPLVHISTRSDKEPAVLEAIANGVHRALVATIGIPDDDRFQIVSTHAENELIFDQHYMGVERRDVVFVQITLVRGRTPGRKKELYRRIAANLAADAGIRPEDVVITLTENDRIDWSVGNGVAQLVEQGESGEPSDRLDSAHAGVDSPPERVRVTADPDWYESAGISLGVRVGNLVFTSGQAPVDGQGRTVGTGDFEAQVRQALANLSTVLVNGGSSLADTIKATVFVTDIRQQDVFTRLRAEYFPDRPHLAETFVEVSSLADPRWMVEIEAIGLVRQA